MKDTSFKVCSDSGQSRMCLVKVLRSRGMRLIFVFSLLCQNVLDSPDLSALGLHVDLGLNIIFYLNGWLCLHAFHFIYRPSGYMLLCVISQWVCVYACIFRIMHGFKRAFITKRAFRGPVTGRYPA